MIYSPALNCGIPGIGNAAPLLADFDFNNVINESGGNVGTIGVDDGRSDGIFVISIVGDKDGRMDCDG